jgi:hypothetical protein
MQQSSLGPLSFLSICLRFASPTEVEDETGNRVGFLSPGNYGRSADPNHHSNDATYTVQGATPKREAVLRRQIQVMQPSVLPFGSVSCLTGSMSTPPRCTNSTCPAGWEARCSPTCRAGAFSSMKIAISVRSGSAIGWPTSLATWRPIALGKKTRKKQPGNTGSACGQRIRKPKPVVNC